MGLVLQRRWTTVQRLWQHVAAPEPDTGVLSHATEPWHHPTASPQGLAPVASLGSLCHALVAARVTPDVIAPAAIRVAFTHFSKPSPSSALPLVVRDRVIPSELALACVMCDAAARTQAGGDAAVAAATLDKALAVLAGSLPEPVATPVPLRHTPINACDTGATSALVDEEHAGDRAAAGVPPPSGGFAGMPSIARTPASAGAKKAAPRGGATNDARVFAELLNPDVVTLFAQWRSVTTEAVSLAVGSAAGEVGCTVNCSCALAQCRSYAPPPADSFDRRVYGHVTVCVPTRATRSCVWTKPELCWC